MDAATLQTKVYSGMGKAAQRIGALFTIYRPSSATSVIVSGNNQGTLNAHFTTNGQYNTPNKPGQAYWQVMLDGTQVAVGDYLVGTPGTFYVAAKQPLLPILAVGCNRTVSITQGGTTPVAVGWPTSILLESSRGDMPLEDIAGNPASPHWYCLLPVVTGINIDVADLVTDDRGRNYLITSAEASEFGWRITMQQTNQLTDSVIQHYQTVIGLIGKVVSLRSSATVAAKLSSASVGASTISLTNIPSGVASISAGDTFLNVGNVLTVTNSTPVAVVAGVAAGVTFTPALTGATANGQSTTLTHNTDVLVKALISNYDKSLINGTTVGVADLRVLVGTTNTSGASISIPQTTQQLIIDGQSRPILSVKPEYAGSVIAVYELQAKG